LHPIGAGNPWIVAADGARRRLPGWLMLAIAAALAAAVVFLGSAAGDFVAEAIVNLLVFGALLSIALVGDRLEGRPVFAASRQGPAMVGLGMAYGFAGIGLALVLASLAGVVASGGQTAGAAAVAGAGLAMIALQSGAEEVYFRGWAQPVLCARWGAPPGLVATAALFAAMHLIAAAGSALALANMFLGGLLFGLLALRTGGLWAPFLAHWSWNWLEGCALGVGPAGGDPSPSLAGLRLTGPAIWSGGSDGLTGGLAATFTLAALILVVIATGPATRRLETKPA
jgi:uncharacterized protein